VARVARAARSLLVPSLRPCVPNRARPSPPSRFRLRRRSSLRGNVSCSSSWARSGAERATSTFRSCSSFGAKSSRARIPTSSSLTSRRSRSPPRGSAKLIERELLEADTRPAITDAGRRAIERRRCAARFAERHPRRAMPSSRRPTGGFPYYAIRSEIATQVLETMRQHWRVAHGRPPRRYRHPGYEDEPSSPTSTSSFAGVTALRRPPHPQPQVRVRQEHPARAAKTWDPLRALAAAGHRPRSSQVDTRRALRGVRAHQPPHCRGLATVPWAETNASH
jgi:hypothetical protein